MSVDTRHIGWYVGRVLKENGGEYMFGFHGGHVWSFTVGTAQHGMKFLQFRHEQSAAYAACAYAEATRKPAFCTATAGPGMWNMTPGIAHSYIAQAPVVVFLGQHPMREDKHVALQEGYGCDVYNSITKWTQRVTDPRQAAFYTKKAIHDCQTYPNGPIAIEIPVDVLHQKIEERHVAEWGFYRPGEPVVKPKSGASPDDVEKLGEILLNSEQPTMLVGTGAYYAHAEEELLELVELLQIPVSLRRLARGMIDERHPLVYIAGESRKMVLPKADTIVNIGIKFTWLEGYGRYCRSAKNVVQINESATEIDYAVPNVKHAVVGNPKVVLRQLIDYLNTQKHRIKRDPAWLENCKDAKRAREVSVEEEMKVLRGLKDGIHPAVLDYEIANFLDDSATIIFDAFTGSDFMMNKVVAHFGGHIQTANETGGVGHGVGMGIGTQLARPGKQVLANMGDTGMGIALADVETAFRYNLPVVYVVHNNAKGIAGLEDIYLYDVLNLTDSHYNYTPGLRYDQMFSSIGVHGEHVTEEDQIRPALERAFNSGKTAVINVMVHPLATHRNSITDGGFYTFIEADEMSSEEGKKIAYSVGEADEGARNVRKYGLRKLEYK